MKKLFNLVVLVVVIWVVWYLASPLFIDVEVDEEAPVVETVEQVTNLEEQIPDEAMMEEFKTAMKELDEGITMDESAPEEPSGPTTVSTGSFMAVAHQGTGSATILNVDGSFVLRFENLSVDNGPDLRVLLSPNENVRSSGDLGESIELAKLKGNKGNQNYAIPEGTDVSQYKSVVIYCKPFKVVFNAANLK